jgi:hypothetical protein
MWAVGVAVAATQSAEHNHHWKEYKETWHCDERFPLYPGAADALTFENQEPQTEYNVPRGDQRVERQYKKAAEKASDLTQLMCSNLGIAVLSGASDLVEYMWSDFESVLRSLSGHREHVDDEALLSQLKQSSRAPPNALSLANRIVFNQISTDAELGSILAGKRLLPALWQVPFLQTTFAVEAPLHTADLALFKVFFRDSYAHGSNQAQICKKTMKEAKRSVCCCCCCCDSRTSLPCNRCHV